ELEAHVHDVLVQLEQNSEAFENISKKFGAWIQLVAYFKVMYPGLSFESDIVTRLAKYNLGVDFDFYYLYSDQREDT
ncbi:MAG: hypothetical protein AAGF26_06955, partial [Cyanobacteria bacterium P01_G01_bin.49]